MPTFLEDFILWVHSLLCPRRWKVTNLERKLHLCEKEYERECFCGYTCVLCGKRKKLHSKLHRKLKW